MEEMNPLKWILSEIAVKWYVVNLCSRRQEKHQIEVWDERKLHEKVKSISELFHFCLYGTVDWRFCHLLPTIHMLKPDAQCDDIGRQGLWGVIRSRGWSSHKWDQCPYKRDPRELPAPTSTCRLSKLNVNQGSDFHQAPNLYVPWSWLSTPRTMRNN